MAEGGVASGASGFQIIALGTAQTIAWASSAYLPAVISQPVAHTLGVSTSTVFAAYSFGLLVMAALGPVIGRSIDRHGGRGVLCFSNVAFVAGLLLLGSASSVVMLFAAWAVIGAGMALGLYDAAFAALVRQHGMQAWQSITGITLLAGFASTIGWPLTSAVVAASDWPTACLMWATAHLLIALPLNWLTLSPATSLLPSAELASATAHPDDIAGSRRAFVLVAVFGTATSFVTSAMAAHLPGLLQALGVAAGLAIAASALVGPAQVAARAIEFVASKRLRVHPLSTARVAVTLHPVGGLVLLIAGGMSWAPAVFALLHGAGNGLITIAKGTLPLALFGASGYGVRQGVLAIGQRLAQAAAPFLLALILEHWGGGVAILLTGALSGIGLLALAGIKRTASAAPIQ